MQLTKYCNESDELNESEEKVLYIKNLLTTRNTLLKQIDEIDQTLRNLDIIVCSKVSQQLIERKLSVLL